MNSATEEMYTDPAKVPPIPNLPTLISELHKVFDSERVNVDYVKALMAAYKSNPKDWKKYAKFDEFRYTRNLVDNGNGRFNLIALCWGEGHGSSIHDHMNSHCFMKMLQGELVETQFAWPESVKRGDKMDIDDDGEELEPMKEIARHVYKKDMVTYINDSIGLHRVENMSHTEKAISLHLYSPPFSECHTFDQRTGHQRTAKTTFWSIYGERSPFSAEANECAAAAAVVDSPRGSQIGSTSSSACCSVARKTSIAKKENTDT